MEALEIESIIESILFVSGEPVPQERIAAVQIGRASCRERV